MDFIHARQSGKNRIDRLLRSTRKTKPVSFDLMISGLNPQDLLAFTHTLLVLFLTQKTNGDEIRVVAICRHILMLAYELFEEIDPFVDIIEIFGEDKRMRELEI